MKKLYIYSLITMITIILLLITLVAAPVIFAEGGLSITMVANITTAAIGDNVTYTYTITNTSTDNITLIKLTDSKFGVIPLPPTPIILATGDNTTLIHSHTVTFKDLLQNKIENTANIEGITSTAAILTDTSNVVVVSLTLNKKTLTKSEVLQLSGVTGKGMLKAPGLQKLFNPKSQAAEHAGKKNK